MKKKKSVSFSTSTTGRPNMAYWNRWPGRQTDIATYRTAFDTSTMIQDDRYQNNLNIKFKIK